MKFEQEKLLECFFDFEFDKMINNYILNDEFNIIREKILVYIYKIVDTPINCFIEYINKNCKREVIMASDVFQFSNLNNATTNICSSIKEINNPGLKFKIIGELLLDDGINRSDVALNKYGENHIKMAESLGLAFKNDKKYYYLSGIGMIYNELPTEVRENLLTRLVLRNKLIVQIIISSTNGKLDLEAFLYDLSRSTYVRRKSNIRKIIGLLESSSEYNFTNITNNIIY